MVAYAKKLQRTSQRTVSVCRPFFYVFASLRKRVRFLIRNFVHIRTNQTFICRTKVFRKKFFVKGYRSILKYRFYRSYTKFLCVSNVTRTV